MVHLTITAVELTNHGPLQGTRRFEPATEGLAVYVRPNESGKTTLLESVAGVLWGETATSKSWSCAPQEPHCGAVEFVRSQPDGVRRFRVERDFQTHRVVAWELDDNGQRCEVFSGTHNPAGRTPDQRRWPDSELPRLWAAISCDAFRHLAMLRQPLPSPEQLEGNLVQQLISGSGAGTAEDAYEALVERFRGISKSSREAGISKVNARKDGRLDELLARRDELHAELSQAAGDLELAEGLREQLDRIDRQQQEIVEGNKHQEASLKLIEQYRELNKDLEGALQRTKELENAEREARDADRQIAAADEETADLPEGLGEVAEDELPGLSQKLDDFRLRSARLKDQEEFTRRRDTLRQQHANVRDWPADAMRRIAPLQEATERVDSARQQSEQLRQRLDDLPPQPDALRRRIVAAAAGLSSAAVTATIAVLFGSPLMAVALAALAGTAAGLGTYGLFRPQKVHPDYPQAADEYHAAREGLEEAERAIESATAAVNWTPQRNLTRLVQLAERRSGLQRELDELAEQQSQQDRLRAELDPDRLPGPLSKLLESCQGSAEEAAGRLDRFRRAVAERRAAQERIGAALGTLGCRDRDELDARLQECQDRRLGIRRELDRLAKENALADELRQLEGEQIETRRRELKQRVEENRRELEQLDQQRQQVQRELNKAELGGNVNVAEVEGRLLLIEGEIDRLTGRCQAIRRAHRLLGEAAGSYSAHHRQAVEAQINDLMAAWTGRGVAEGAERRFTVAEDFSLGLSVETADRGQKEVELSTLSEGARDQLAMAARTAVLDRLGAEVVLPMLIDDAFLCWDSQRRQRLLGVLEAAAGKRQIILVSHDRAFEGWGEPVVCRDHASG